MPWLHQHKQTHHIDFVQEQTQPRQSSVAVALNLSAAARAENHMEKQGHPNPGALATRC